MLLVYCNVQGEKELAERIAINLESERNRDIDLDHRG